MKKKSDRLGLVKDMRDREKDQIGRRLAEVNEEYKRQTQRLHDLQSHQQSYLKSSSKGGGEGQVLNMSAYHTFLAQIATAIELQIAVVENLEKSLKQAQKEYALSSLKAQTMGDLAHRESLKEASQQVKEEEKRLNDELTSRNAHRRS